MKLYGIEPWLMFVYTKLHISLESKQPYINA